MNARDATALRDVITEMDDLEVEQTLRVLEHGLGQAVEHGALEHELVNLRFFVGSLRTEHRRRNAATRSVGRPAAGARPWQYRWTHGADRANGSRYRGRLC
jgi:hypothetical protein